MDNLYDVIVIGGGPAGLTSGIYLARAKYKTLIFEKETFGGQITITSEVVNYPGVYNTSGKELTETMRRQAESFGAEFALGEVLSIENDGDFKVLKTSKGTYKAFGIIVATGAHPRQLGFTGESELRGRGVAYCATCDGEFFTGREVFVIGGGFAAAEESVFLTKYASKVTVIMITDDFTCAKATADATKKHPKIDIIYNTAVEEIRGENGVTYIRYKNLKNGEVTEYTAKEGESFGVFVFAGYIPATSLVKDLVELDEAGYIVTDKNQKTSCDGIYAAGDVCIKSLRQVVTATGDGALAATEMEKYVAQMHEKTGIKPEMKEVIAPKAAGTDEESSVATSGGKIINDQMASQLEPIFSRMTDRLVLKLYLDDRSISSELKEYMDELAALTDKISVEVAENSEYKDLPMVEIVKEDGTATGLAFHGVPGGHEFTSFVLGLYNAASPGQAVDEDVKAKISKLSKADIKIMVSLSCTMCPELVTAAQRIATLNENITAHVYDINHFGHMKEKYRVMSVPCCVINNEHISFGKKNVNQLVEILESI